MDNKEVKTRIAEIRNEINEYKDLLSENSVPQDEKDFAKGLIIDLEKELIDLYKEMGEVKTEIFYNPLIFVDASDYILGGFKKEELQNVEIVGDDSALSFPKLEFVFDNRLNAAIELSIQTNEDITAAIESYLELSRFESSNGEVFVIIKTNPSYQYWINEIRERLVEYKSKPTYKKEDVNENLQSEVELEDAETYTNTSTLIEMLEQLSYKLKL